MSSDKPKLLITGANGFIGSRLSEVVAHEGYSFRRAVRNSAEPETVIVDDIGPDTDWSVAVDDIEVLVHLAARVHVMNEKAGNPLAEYWHVNVDATLNLARQAAEAGVQRFIYLSSIKVNGESTQPGKPFTAEDSPAPEDSYAVSKWEAELGLHRLAKDTGLEVVIIRPPLVYGPGVKGNFLSMIRWISVGLPLPLGTIRNKRSYVALDNLVDLIITCTVHPAAANQTFLVRDDEDLSTTDLLRHIGEALGKPARLIPFPAALLKLGASLLGQQEMVRRMYSCLQVDSFKTRNLLEWNPPVSTDEGLRRTVEGLQK